MQATVIYHKSDYDGIFCREIARKFIPDAQLIGWEYGEPEPFVQTDGRLYILDLSVEGLMNHPRLVWIDHHKTAIEKYPPKIMGYRIDGVAACRLAWQWFKSLPEHATPNFAGRGIEETLPSKQDFIDRKVSEPLAVRLAGEYDIWDKRDPEAELFQHGLGSVELTPAWWKTLLALPKPENQDGRNTVADLLRNGMCVQYAKTKENEELAKTRTFEMVFEGLRFLAINAVRCNSATFEAACEIQHEGLLGFYWNGKVWTVSLYHSPSHTEIDLSKIAVKYGGGGHPGACGFRAKWLPFLP